MITYDCSLDLTVFHMFSLFFSMLLYAKVIAANTADNAMLIQPYVLGLQGTCGGETLWCRHGNRLFRELASIIFTFMDLQGSHVMISEVFTVASQHSVAFKLRLETLVM